MQKDRVCEQPQFITLIYFLFLGEAADVSEEVVAAAGNNG